MNPHMERWKQTISAGNRCFKQNQLITALALYYKAKNQSQSLLYEWHDPEQAAACVVISCQNIADLYVREQQPEMAEKELLHSVSLIDGALEACKPEQQQRRSALVYAQSRSRQALLMHYQQCHQSAPHLSITTNQGYNIH